MTEKFNWGVIALALMLFGSGANAQVNFLSGGVGLDEQEALTARGKEFNLKVVTAAERSGAYLAGVHVKISDASDATVLEALMDGPWLLARIPAGVYTIKATFEGKTVTESAVVPKTGQRQVHLYWRIPELFVFEREEETSPPKWLPPGASTP